jgi:hypothetical protein
VASQEDDLGAASTRKGVLQTVTELAGLFAAAAALVYFTGAVVLSLRLAIEDIPWTNVVPQLPREFVVSTGVGQVLLPSLLVGGLYGLYRLILPGQPKAPEVYRLRDNWKAKGIVLVQYGMISVLILVPLFFVIAVRDGTSVGDLGWVLTPGIVIVSVLAAMAAQEGRAIVIEHFKDDRHWNSVKAGASVAGVYAAAAIPAMMLAAAAIPLSGAKICTTESYAEKGLLVGESSDRIYLGQGSSEEGHSQRMRIAVLPFSKIEELFIGPEARKVHCEFSGEKTSAPKPPSAALGKGHPAP